MTSNQHSAPPLPTSPNALLHRSFPHPYTRTALEAVQDYLLCRHAWRGFPQSDTNGLPPPGSYTRDIPFTARSSIHERRQRFWENPLCTATVCTCMTTRKLIYSAPHSRSGSTGGSSGGPSASPPRTRRRSVETPTTFAIVVSTRISEKLRGDRWCTHRSD